MSLRSGDLQVKRLTIPDPVANFIIPETISDTVLKNVGTKDFRFNFTGDFATHYWTLKIGETSPVLKVNGGRKFYTDGIGGSTIVEVLMWG